MSLQSLFLRSILSRSSPESAPPSVSVWYRCEIPTTIRPDNLTLDGVNGRVEIPKAKTLVPLLGDDLRFGLLVHKPPRGQWRFHWDFILLIGRIHSSTDAEKEKQKTCDKQQSLNGVESWRKV